MNNYYYIVASLPDIKPDWKFSDKNAETFLGEIKNLCSSKDEKHINMLFNGFNEDELTEDFYLNAAKYPNTFINEYFNLDLNIRNTKVKYLNKALGRDAKKDIIPINIGNFEEEKKLEIILEGSDIIERERAIDNLIWTKIDELTKFHYFDIHTILGFLAKLHIIDRWYKLDEENGREMFKKLVDEVRGTFKGVEYDANKEENESKENK